MDSYEATRIVFSKIQNIDPENASKIMGFLLIQDLGEKEMVRFAFGPETLIHTLIITAYTELGLSSSSTPSPPSPFHHTHQHPLSRQNSSSSSRIPVPVPSSSWAPPTAVDIPSYASVVGNNGIANGNGNGHELFDEFHLQEQLSFLNEALPQKNPDSFYPSLDMPTSPNNNNNNHSDGGGGGGMLIPNWGQQQQHHRRSLSVTDMDPFGWKPCLYYARGYCKNGTSCRFLHAPPDSPDSGSPSKLDVMEQCHEFLMRSKSLHHQQQRLSNASSSFPYSPSASKCMNFMLQQQHNDTQRAAAAAAAAGLILGGEDLHQFSRARMERNDFPSMTGAGLVNPGSRQIYLTFPADSTFREEDVSNYFSIYGPVQDVRIPYQQKRMFGFVTFIYPETVKLILAKGNPHFVCDARVLVKPYKEKGKVPDKKQQQQLVERGEFSPSASPTGHDHRDPYDLQLGMQMQSSPRLLYNTHELLMRRKLDEQAELQQAIELHSRKLMGLHLFDGNKHHRRNVSAGTAHFHSPTYPHALANHNFNFPTSSPEEGTLNELEDNCARGDIAASLVNTTDQNSKLQAEFSCKDNGKENSKPGDGNSHDSVEDNLPDSPFASPTETNGDMFFTATIEVGQSTGGASSAPLSSLQSSSSSSNNDNVIAPVLLPTSTALDMGSFKSRFLQMPRLSSDNGAIPM